MKKFLKKLSCALLAAAMVCAMTPLAASAAINYSKTRIVYMPTSGKDLGYDEISISRGDSGALYLQSATAGVMPIRGLVLVELPFISGVDVWVLRNRNL